MTIAILAYAQKDVTQFMGIPVDGFKPEMIQKLKAKGFVSSGKDSNLLKGEFNGAEVYVKVVTNNNKVCRIMLIDECNLNETDIRIRFNNLCRQFKNNSKYTSVDDYSIPEDEDLSFEMRVHNKRYEAVIYQNPVVTDSTAVIKEMHKFFLQKYTEEELNNPTKEIELDMKSMITSYFTDVMINKSVWFMISESYGKYYISMFYDNEYNRAQGEDL